MPWARALTQLLASIGAGIGLAASFVSRHPIILAVAGLLAVGAVFGAVAVNLAMLVGPMRILYFLLYTAVVPAAALSAQKDSLLSRRLVVGALASFMGLLSMRVIYWDLLHLELDPAFRSNLIGIFGLVSAALALKVR